MKIIDVNCNHCGATLQVDEKTRFVTCGYCNSRLAIQQSASAVFTQVLDKIEENTGHIAENLELIKRQNELEQLDREWMMSRDNLLVRGQNGRTSTPSVAGGIFALLIGVGGGIAWTIFATSMGAPWFFTAFGILFTCAALFGGVSVMVNGGKFDSARQSYEARRRQLTGEIDAEKRR
jgi:hypothetical protein